MQGIRTCKATATSQTYFLLDGGNVTGERTGSKTVTYLRGANLISRSDGSKKTYYLFNAHGDVTELVSDSSTVTHKYDYDAFGVEKKPDPLDGNPFRYCGEYYDGETKTYYLRARYYDPNIGRFTQQDTHWSVANMIYGDTPRKINEREDKLGLKSYSYAPQITAVMQSGNLYVYGVNNPVAYVDTTGNFVITTTFLVVAGAILFGTIGGLIGNSLANQVGATGWDKVGYIAGLAVVGAAVGALAGWTVAAASGLTVAGCSGTLGGTIYATWQQAEQSIRDTYNAVKYTFTDLAQGMSNRIVDGYNEAKGTIYEVKYGAVSLSKFIQSEIERDIYLMQTGRIKFVEWHFFISNITGKGGPSGPLLEALLNAGIKVVYH